jgi:hypothetical protein
MTPSLSLRLLTSAALMLAYAGAALAQTAPKPAPAPVSAPKAPKQVLSPYDEDAARHIAEGHGFYGVGPLKLDLAGVWRGTAIQFGRIVDVTVDPQGNFTGFEKRPKPASRRQ